MKDSWIIVIAIIIVAAFLGSALTVLMQPEPVEAPVVELSFASDSGAANALRTGEADAAVIAEPYWAEAESNGFGQACEYVGEVWSGHPGRTLAYDGDWYASDVRADDTVQRIALVIMLATGWIDAAKNASSSNHSQLVTYAKDLTGRNTATVELALPRIDFDTAIRADDMELAVEKQREYGLLGNETWNSSGYESEGQYVGDVAANWALQWAGSNIGQELANVSMSPAVDVRFGYLAGDMHCLAFWVALKMGWFDDAGITVTAVSYADTATEMTTGFKANNVDVGVVEAGSALYLGITINQFNATRPKYNDARVVFFSGLTTGGSAIVLKPGLSIDTYRDLEGKKVAVAGEGSIQHLALLTLLKRDRATWE